MSNRTTCPDCQLEGKHKRNVGIYEDNMYCFRCEKVFDLDGETGNSQGPKHKLDVISSVEIPDGKLNKKRISADTLKAFKCPILENIELKYGELSFTLKLALKVNYSKDSFKLKEPSKEVLWINYQKNLPMFGGHLHDSSRKNIIITEGEEDAMAVWQSLGSNALRSLNHVTSLALGAGSAVDFVKQHYDKLVQYETVTLCFDMDEKGMQAKDKVIPLFAKYKIRVVKLPVKDAADMMAAHKDEELKWAVLKAESIVPSGIVRIGDLDPKFFTYKIPPGVDIPFPKLNSALASLHKGLLTMVTAGTGIGKSSFVNNIVYHLVNHSKLKVADIKLEESVYRTIGRYASMYFEDERYRSDLSLLTEDQRNKYKDGMGGLIIHDHFGSLSANELLNVLDYYALSEKVDFIVLDHISMAISGNVSSKEGERKDIDILLTKMRALANSSGTGIICVSHVSNPSVGKQWEEGRKVNRNALRGSGSLAHLSDNIIGIEGNLVDDATKKYRSLRLLKTRYGNEQEVLCDSFTYDYKTGKIYLADLEDLSEGDIE